MNKIITLLLLITCLSVNNGQAQTWLAMASGLGSSTETVKAIAENPVTHEIYAGGTFTTPVSYIAKWNGTAWEQVGTGVNGPVYALSFKNQELYVGGLFNGAGGISVNNIAKWSSNAWSDVNGGFNGQVNCLFISSSSGSLYAGGTFSLAGSTSMMHISKLVSNNWTALGSGVSAVVNAIAEFGGTQYVGCDNSSGPVQKYDGSNWTPVSGISGGKVYALASYSNYLYAGGDFSVPTFAGAKYDGNAWSTIITAFSSSDKIYALSARFSTILYIAGKFTNLGVGSASYAAKITLPTQPIQAFTTSSAPSGEVYAIGNQSGKVIVGGKFSSPATNIAITSTTINVNELSDLVVDKNFYPNPVVSKAHFTVSTKERLKHPELMIYDLQSRVIQNLSIEKNINNNEIEFIVDCANLPAGNYYYTLSDEGKGLLSDKFVITHE